MAVSLCPGYSRDHVKAGSPVLGQGLDTLLCLGLDL